MSKKGIRVTYAEVIALLSIFKVTVRMDKVSLEKCEMQVVLLEF